MAKRIHHVVACYDIADHRRLQKVAQVMKDYGERVLKSVFEANLTRDQFQRLRVRIDALIDHTEDSVRYYFLCDKCLAQVEFSGSGSGFVEDQELVLT